MFLVVNSEVEKEQSWLLDRNNYKCNMHERDAEIIQLKDIVNDSTCITTNQHPNSNNKAINNADHCH